MEEELKLPLSLTVAQSVSKYSTHTVSMAYCLAFRCVPANGPRTGPRASLLETEVFKQSVGWRAPDIDTWEGGPLISQDSKTTEGAAPV